MWYKWEGGVADLDIPLRVMPAHLEYGAVPCDATNYGCNAVRVNVQNCVAHRVRWGGGLAGAAHLLNGNAGVLRQDQ